MAEYNMNGGAEERRRGSHIAVDLIVMFVIFALIAGIIIGIAAMIRYASTKYDSVDVEYALLIENADEAALAPIAENQDVYLIPEDGSPVNIGKIRLVKTDTRESGELSATVTVGATCDYKAGLGYFVEENRIAVGQTVECRFNGYYGVCTVISLKPEG